MLCPAVIIPMQEELLNEQERDLIELSDRQEEEKLVGNGGGNWLYLTIQS